MEEHTEDHRMLHQTAIEKERNARKGCKHVPQVLVSSKNHDENPPRAASGIRTKGNEQNQPSGSCKGGHRDQRETLTTTGLAGRRRKLPGYPIMIKKKEL